MDIKSSNLVKKKTSVKDHIQHDSIYKDQNQTKFSSVSLWNMFVAIKVKAGNDEHKYKMMVMTVGAAGACTVGKYKRIQRSLGCSFLNYIVANPIILSLFSKLYQFSSVTQLCPTLCSPMDYSTPVFPVHHQLPELAQTHVH